MTSSAWIRGPVGRWLVALIAFAALAFAARWLDQRLSCAGLLLRLERAQQPGWLVHYRERPVRVRDYPFAGGQGRLYRPDDERAYPGVVVAHGMHEQGIDEPRLIALSQALAGAGFVVLTPAVVGLAHYRIVHSDVELISVAAGALAHEVHSEQVAVFGISFGGGLAIRAACEPGLRAPIARVIALGAHHDAARVSRFYLGQPALGPHGERAEIEPHPYGRVALWQSLFGQLHKGEFSEPERLQVLAGVEAQTAELERASPRGCPVPLGVPLFLVHGNADRVVPFTETLWNQAQFSPQTEVLTLISPAIVHAEYAPVSSRDRARLVDFMAQAIY